MPAIAAAVRARAGSPVPSPGVTSVATQTEGSPFSFSSSPQPAPSIMLTQVCCSPGQPTAHASPCCWRLAIPPASSGVRPTLCIMCQGSKGSTCCESLRSLSISPCLNGGKAVWLVADGALFVQKHVQRKLAVVHCRSGAVLVTHCPDLSLVCP